MWTDTIATLGHAQRAALAARINAQAQRIKTADTQLVAYVVTDGMAHVDDLRAHLAARLPPHMLPARIVLLDALPLTPNGKVDRNALPDPNDIESSFDDTNASDFIEPRTDTERAIAAVWRNLLSMDALSVRDNFFELGGHSLLVTRAVAQLRETFDVPISVNIFFEHPTIEGLAVRIGALQAAQNASVSTDQTGNADMADMEEIEL